jgi:hypothetical protein
MFRKYRPKNMLEELEEDSAEIEENEKQRVDEEYCEPL